MMRTNRTRSVTVRVTEAQYDAMADAAMKAGAESVSAWAYTSMLGGLGRRPVEDVLLAEILALRVVLLNVVRKLAGGDASASALVEQAVALADAEKHERARQALHGAAS